MFLGQGLCSTLWKAVVMCGADRSDCAWSQGHIHCIADLTPVVTKCGLGHCDYQMINIVSQFEDPVVHTTSDVCPINASQFLIAGPQPSNLIFSGQGGTLESNDCVEWAAVKVSGRLSSELVGTL